MTRTYRPLQNRVDPFGELQAVDARGSLMGNRGGRIHREDKTLSARRWASRRWIACVCEFKGRHREVFGAGYTELFFFDEPTALAAGHRPCFECRRPEAEAFRDALSPGARLSADEMDVRLHEERLERTNKRRHAAPIETLPDGAMIARGAVAFLVRGEALLPWSFGGYGEPLARPRRGEEDVLTPPTMLRALKSGYAPRA